MGRYGKALLGVGAVAAVLTTVGDVVVRRLREGGLPDPRTVPDDVRRVQEELAELRRTSAAPAPSVPRALSGVRSGLAVSAVLSTALAASTTWAAMTSGRRLFTRSPLDLGGGAAAGAAAVLGWDFIYYWNHRFSHESRWLWAIHVVHHSQRALQPLDRAAAAGGRGR